MKKILGLDLGTNSIGWALVEQDFDKKQGSILGMGSRIIPMGQDMISDFNKGTTISLTAKRTGYRGTRRLYQRDNLRRERLHRVLNILGFLPKHYAKEIDFEHHKGQFLNYGEPKLAYHLNISGKYEFLFKESFNEMVEDFKKTQPYLFDSGKKIPYDWTIYYLRNKALKQKITKEEFAWLILNFNQKRGYYQLSEEEETDSDNKIKEFVVLNVKDVIETGEVIKSSGAKLYEVIFDNGWKYDRLVVKVEDWIGKTREFIVTISKTKDGEDKISYKAVDSEKDWAAIKKKTEQEIVKSKKTVGEFIYESLLQNPTQKIRGRLVKTIERKFYKDEFKQILEKQIQFHNEFRDRELYKLCINELYPNNEAHRKNIKGRDFTYLLKDDIIFYQRPLRTKTHLISDCSLEYRIVYSSKEKVGVKCIAKSNPLFQEFRLWQFLANLKIYNKADDKEVTIEFLKEESDWVDLFDWLNSKEKIRQKQLLSYFKLKEENYRWNYVEDKEYPCNETRASILNRYKKTGNDVSLEEGTIISLWHILYSVTDPEQRKKAVERFANKHALNDSFIESFSKFPLIKRDYGSFSEKAIKKLLPLMRRGKYWNKENISKEAIFRYDSLYNRLEAINHDLSRMPEIIDDEIPIQVIKSFINSSYSISGLNTSQASYLVYGRHSEAKDNQKWRTSDDISFYLKNVFKQHSLRNPIVEQVLSETLRVVKDIWDEYGNGEEDYFDEIHIELGREMKNPKQKREQISKTISENENTNIRIRAILNELLNDGVDVRPYSPSHQEILKIYEEGISQNPNAKFDKINEDEISKIRKNSSPSSSDIKRYKLWLEQGYISPYTGRFIKLSELFTHKYQIEHIIPQSRYFDDSLSNKIICESEVNELKDNRTAYEFIKEFQGFYVNTSGGEKVKILKLDEYENHVRAYFFKNKVKRDNLLSVDIPESFINRQMTDSRYISKAVKGLLSKIVIEEGEQEATSKNLTVVTGAITSQMKQDWGLNDVWNDIISPRFKRMNELTKTNDFGRVNSNTNKFLPDVPESLKKGFNKKRIDHRHHALDALVIACVTKDHVNYITSLNTQRKNHALISKLRRVEQVDKNKTNPDGTSIKERITIAKEYHKPWERFTQDTRKNLETLIVSFKQNTRVINKTKNKYLKWVTEENGQLKKKIVPQDKGDNWAIRKALHKETVYGEVTLIRDGKTFKAHAGRVPLSESFTQKQLNSITDTGIQKILENHVANYIDEKGDKRFDFAFSQTGIEDLNKNIVQLNNGKWHQPINKVRLYEVGNKFQVGNRGGKSAKFVEAAKGTNLFFAIYQGKNKKGEWVRQYQTIPLNEAIESLKQGGNPAPVKYFDKDKSEYELLFTLSPNDLVYVPTEQEIDRTGLIDFSKLSKEQINRIYKMEKASGTECYFIRNDISTLIKQYDPKSKFGELSSQNKLETTMDVDDNVKIKETCWKLDISRTGKITKVNR